MLQKRYFTLADLNQYAKSKNINENELRIFICRDIEKFQKTDSVLPIYALIDRDNDLRIVINKDIEWKFNKYWTTTTYRSGGFLTSRWKAIPVVPTVQNVYCCIDISVMYRLTINTNPFSIITC